MARNRNGEVYVVCSYNPAGNFLGSFTENVPPPGSTYSPKKGSSVGVQFNQIDDSSWQQEALLVHNEYRRKHRVPDLKLNTELTAAAKVRTIGRWKFDLWVALRYLVYFQAWAETLLQTNKLIHQSTSPYGENIYSMHSSDPKFIVSAREVVSKWYSEKKEHKYGSEPRVLNTCKSYWSKLVQRFYLL